MCGLLGLEIGKKNFVHCFGKTVHRFRKRSIEFVFCTSTFPFCTSNYISSGCRISVHRLTILYIVFGKRSIDFVFYTSIWYFCLTNQSFAHRFFNKKLVICTPIYQFVHQSFVHRIRITDHRIRILYIHFVFCTTISYFVQSIANLYNRLLLARLHMDFPTDKGIILMQKHSILETYGKWIR